MNSLNKNIIAITEAIQDQISPQDALKILKEGNQRFVAQKKLDRNPLDQISMTSESQYPFAAILGCIDSRVPAEMVFDLGIGDSFNTRIAGNFVNKDILGSLEFACKVAGAKIIVVLGHKSCGAVKGACANVELGNLTSMLEKIQPAVEIAKAGRENVDTSSPEFIQKVADLNVELAIKKIKTYSPILNEMYENNEIDIVGAMYDITTGEVEFFD